MVVLDELYFSVESVADIVGGSGTYGTLGARLFLPFPASTSIGWIVRAGNDFPNAIKTQLESWRCTLLFTEEKDKLTTRGRLSYKDELGTKTFEYLTPVMNILPSHLKSTSLLSSRSFHLLSSPEEVIEQVSSLMRLRREARIKDLPLIIWEPRPSSCIPKNLEAFFRAVRVVDVFSPNHIEFAQIFGNPIPQVIDQKTLERYASQFTESGIGQSGSGAVVLRAGEKGCMVVSQTQPAEWIPAFYESFSESAGYKVTDPTGAGNAFLGAFAIGLLETKDLARAACYGNVGASFAVEQIGIPQLEVSEAGKEFWNGAEVFLRLRNYTARVQREAIHS